MSAISNSSDVPTMYRINLPRRADYAKELIYGCQLVYLESNHDKKMLMACKYPYIIKKKSNNQTIKGELL